MQVLRFGDRGAEVALLQKALVRADAGSLALDGIFGEKTRAAVLRFQRRKALVQDGIVGEKTLAALEPWLIGSVRHTLRAGDTLWKLSLRYGSSLTALETANPALDPFHLMIGQTLTVPLPFEVVPTDIPWCSALTGYCIRGLAARYPSIRTEVIGRSVLGRELFALTAGSGARRVLYTAAHHANEWITAPVLLHYAEELLSAASLGERIFGADATELLSACTVGFVPAVDPDGIDLVTGSLTASARSRAAAIAQNYPRIPFPDGWKANIDGVDLNLQYPAGWEEARRIKAEQGFASPAPRDYVGTAPLTAPESAALAAYTERVRPALILAYHTQGGVIYWKYRDIEVAGSRALAERFAAVSGYSYEDTPYASGFAGYKDWFIEKFDRPGFTVEVGQGENPLPITQFDEIYAKNRGILTLAALG